MRWQFLRSTLLAFLICGVLSSCASTAVPRRSSGQEGSQWIKKTVFYQTGAADFSYAITLAPRGRRFFQCSIEIVNRGQNLIFFLRAAKVMSARKRRNARYLDASIGIQEQHFEYSIPRLAEIRPGRRLTATYQIDCKGECDDLNTVDVDLYLIIKRGRFFHDLFNRLPDYGNSLGLNMGKDWALFYSYLQRETVSFALVPAKS